MYEIRSFALFNDAVEGNTWIIGSGRRRERDATTRETEGAERLTCNHLPGSVALAFPFPGTTDTPLDLRYLTC